jgi:hypothetical protein
MSDECSLGDFLLAALSDEGGSELQRTEEKPQHPTVFSCLSATPGIIGVVVDSVTPSKVIQLVPKIQSALDLNGFVLLRNLGDWSASSMCEFMIACFGEGGLSSYANLPRDPARDGDSDAPGANVPGEERVRMIGNGREPSTVPGLGNPKCLMANLGYEWHQVQKLHFKS